MTNQTVTTVDDQIAFFRQLVQEEYPGRTLEQCLRAVLTNMQWSTLERVARICDVAATDAPHEYFTPPEQDAAADMAKRLARTIRLTDPE